MPGLHLSEQAPQAFLSVGDAARPKGVPVGGGVDRDDWLSEPGFSLGGELDHRQVGADLNDGVDIVPVELEQRAAQALFCDFRYVGPAMTAQRYVAHHFEAAIVQKAPDVGISRRII